ncbi:VOC family protein [Shewanella waksmanii]|uniref:VOC family protein n=1 Tax=Shewanella waksmanii TaxID=213783 RepID=UPI0037368CAD
MAKVIGLGGIFFKSEDPASLAQWYKTYLNIPIEPWGGAAFYLDRMTPENSAGYSVWTPLAKETDYIHPSNNHFMFNLVVDDLDGALAQVTEGGAEVIAETEESEFGRFGWFIDPEGNKVELWQTQPINKI